jgi:iron complex outermembrane receptor protein
MHRKTALLYGAALTGLLVTPALAQDVAAPATARTTIETVIVTAEKREQKAQDVPVALSAISGDMMDSLGIRDVTTLGQRVPNLHFGPGPTGGENFITMRGLTSANTTNGGDTPVSFAIDGVYFGRSTGVDPEMFDIQTIEVLRGPQGTLYGRNSVGGSINVITNKPTDELSGHVDALVGDYNARIFRGWANVPLYSCGDCKILARIVGVSANHDGYQKNLSTAPTATYNSDGQDYDMIRGHLLFQFNADVDLLLSANQSYSYSPVATKTQWGGDLGYRPGMSPNNRFAGQTWYNDPRVVEKDYPETFKGVQQGMSATFNWNLGFAKLTSITARQKIYMEQSNDADGSNLNMGKSERWRVSTGQYSQEMRLASNNDENPLKWIVGGFYFHEHTEMQFPYSDTGINSVPAFINAASFNLLSANTYKTTSWAAFGQVDYDLGKTSAEIPLTLTTGLRYTHDHKYGFGGIRYYLPGIAVPPQGFLAAATNVRHDQRFGQVTGRVGMSYKVNPDVMLYANVARGYLSGGLLGRTYQPETAMNYELGMKSQFMDNTVQLNLNAFYMDVKDIQVFVQDAALGSRVDNAAGAKIRGAEAELIMIPVEGLRLNMEAMYQSAKYKDYFTDDGRTAGNLIVNNKGNRLVQTPKWTLNSGAEYAFETEAGTITPRIDAFWSSDMYFTAFEDIRARQSSYILVDLGVKWTDVQNKYQIDVFARNIFDRDIISSDGTQSGSFGYGLQVDNFTYRAPRTIGARFGVNF